MMTSDHELPSTAWQLVHEGLVQLAKSRGGFDLEEGLRLRAALLASVHVRLGYGSFVEYIERLFGYSPRLTYEKLRVAEALEALPELATALGDARLSWSVLRELTRVATAETEHEWLTVAAGLTARQVQALVSGHRPGSQPDAPRDDSARRHVLRFEVSAEAFAAFREALGKIRRDAGGPLDDDAALLLLARQALGGPLDDGRASYQLALTVCETCRRATQDARGQVVAVGPEVLAMAECDAQQLGGRGGVEGATLDDCAHVGASGDEPARSPARPARAAQSIPPALRRLVLRRDRHRCVFPGCAHATFVDVHHVRSRADGGLHTAENLATLCGAHHRAVHRGNVTVEGQAPAALRFRHADGSAYGGRVAPLAADTQGCAFRALRGLGFGEAEVRRALSEAAHDPGEPMRFESVLRGALVRLTERSVTRAA